MACDSCLSNLIKEKLGRCKQCMIMNFILLVIGLMLYRWLDFTQLLAVQRIALYLFIGFCGGLMSAHLIAWGYYRYKNKRD